MDAIEYGPMLRRDITEELSPDVEGVPEKVDSREIGDS